jgi:hypothetical protein
LCFYTVLLCQSTLFLSLTGLEVENYVTMSGNTPLDPPAHVQLLGAGVKNPPYSLFHVQVGFFICVLTCYTNNISRHQILILYHYHYATSVTYAVQKTFIMTCRRLSSRLSLVLTPDKDRHMFASLLIIEQATTRNGGLGPRQGSYFFWIHAHQ